MELLTISGNGTCRLKSVYLNLLQCGVLYLRFLLDQTEVGRGLALLSGIYFCSVFILILFLKQ